ncbi:LamG-like jellyroll fold domain-containing protein [Deinococcus sonorensis]|uniref:LamG-like jellyroll fold domain-containing protein n=1 Tax=Deinococcus sonorensis KR-87 TaxID=694439 RepID=A0AAU7UFU4_9DEIO
MFVAAVLDFANSSYTTRLYVDGANVRTVTYSSGSAPYSGRACHNLFIGATPGGDSLTCATTASVTPYEPGLRSGIDDVRVYDRALSDAEIAVLYSENRWPR